jgi:hypothetical protein
LVGLLLRYVAQANIVLGAAGALIRETA